LWGRGTGIFPVMQTCAVLVPLLSKDNKFEITCCVLDSPFTTFKGALQDLICKYESAGYYFPHTMFYIFSKLLRMSIKRRTRIDVYDIKPIEWAPLIQIPALILSATSDDYIDPSHGLTISAQWGGDCEYHAFEGSHFSARTRSVISNALGFLAKQLCLTIY
jgi:hypothetical protein